MDLRRIPGRLSEGGQHEFELTEARRELSSLVTGTHKAVV